MAQITHYIVRLRFKSLNLNPKDMLGDIFETPLIQVVTGRLN